ncbi:unknow [Vibrio campbellii]|nr:unknow [Vibrio campbellii]
MKRSVLIAQFQAVWFSDRITQQSPQHHQKLTLDTLDLLKNHLMMK